MKRLNEGDVYRTVEMSGLLHKRFAGLFAEFMSGVWVCICVLVMVDHGDRHLICAHLC